MNKRPLAGSSGPRAAGADPRRHRSSTASHHRTVCELAGNAYTPTLDVLDPRGVIRYKWVGGPGEKAIDSALEKLMKEVEAPR